MLVPWLLLMPSRAPALTMARHRLAFPFTYANRSTRRRKASTIIDPMKMAWLLLLWEITHFCIIKLVVLYQPVFPSLSGLSRGYSGMHSKNSSKIAAAFSFPYWPRTCMGDWPLERRKRAKTIKVSDCQWILHILCFIYLWSQTWDYRPLHLCWTQWVDHAHYSDAPASRPDEVLLEGNDTMKFIDTGII